MLTKTALVLMTVGCIQVAHAYDPVMEQERERLLLLYHGSSSVTVHSGVSAHSAPQTLPVDEPLHANTVLPANDSVENNWFLSFRGFTF